MLAVDNDVCLECGGCIALCPEEALFLLFTRLECIYELCTLCDICCQFCPVEALEVSNEI